MRSDMNNMQIKINLLERVVSGMDINPRGPVTPLQVTFDDGESEPERNLCGRHAALMKGILRKAADSDTSMMSQEPRETRKRTRANTSKSKLMLESFLNFHKGAVRDGPNGTLELSSEEEGATGNLVIDLTDTGRQVTKEKTNPTPDTSPELEERPRPTQLNEHDARHIIEMRRNLTSTRRLSPTREGNLPEISPLSSPTVRSRSPLRRPMNARDQSQRARLEEEERTKLINAVKDKNAGVTTEDTERLESTEIVFTSREMYEDFLAQATGRAEPGTTLTTILAMVDDQNLTEVTVQRQDTAPRGQSPPRTPPPSYDEATKTEAEGEEEAAAGDTSTITLGSTITLDSSESDRANNNSLDLSVKSATNSANNSVEIVGQMLHGAKQGSHVGPSHYRRINQRAVAENIALYQERLREGQFSDAEEMDPPEVRDVPELPDISTRSPAQSPLSRQEQLPSNTRSSHSSMPSLTSSELSDISDDGINITGHAEADGHEDDAITLHEDEAERAEMGADLSPESREIVDEIDNHIKSYYTTPRGKGKNSTDFKNHLLTPTFPRKRPGHRLKGPQEVGKRRTLTAGLNCMANGDMDDTILLCLKSFFKMYEIMINCGLTEYTSIGEAISLNLGCKGLTDNELPVKAPIQVVTLEPPAPAIRITNSCSTAPPHSNTASSDPSSLTASPPCSNSPKKTTTLNGHDTTLFLLLSIHLCHTLSPPQVYYATRTTNSGDTLSTFPDAVSPQFFYVECVFRVLDRK